MLPSKFLYPEICFLGTRVSIIEIDSASQKYPYRDAECGGYTGPALARCPIAIKSARMYDDGTARGNEFVLIRGGKMFFKCLDCGSVILDPDLNTSQCPVCGSVNFVVEEEQVAGAIPYRLDSPATQTAKNEKLTVL